MSNRVNILVTGQPGIGKTTIIKNLYKRLSSPMLGFYTEEIRDANGVRMGFDIISLEDENNRQPLARVNSAERGPKVGKYTVLLPQFESVAIPCLREAINQDKQLVIIDEIGKITTP